LNRATDIPALNISSKISTVRDTGPSVQMIFDLNVPSDAASPLSKIPVCPGRVASFDRSTYDPVRAPRDSPMFAVRARRALYPPGCPMRRSPFARVAMKRARVRSSTRSRAKRALSRCVSSTRSIERACVRARARQSRARNRTHPAVEGFRVSAAAEGTSRCVALPLRALTMRSRWSRAAKIGVAING
jgi:hypothetical protein